MDSDAKKSTRSYPANPIESFQNGALLDLRVRLAADFLRSSPAIGAVQEYLVNVDHPGTTKDDAGMIAEYALELADALLSGADLRGWIQDLPPRDALSEIERTYAIRSGRYGALQQVGGSKQIAEEQAGAITPAAPGSFKGH